MGAVYIEPNCEFDHYQEPPLNTYRVATGEELPPSSAVQQVQWPLSQKQQAKTGWALDDGFTRGLRAAGAAGKLTLWPQFFPWKQGPFLPQMGPQAVEMVAQPFPTNRIIYGGATPVGAMGQVNKPFPWAVDPYNAEW
jgi:hypothetical protein